MKYADMGNKRFTSFPFYRNGDVSVVEVATLTSNRLYWDGPDKRGFPTVTCYSCRKPVLFIKTLKLQYGSNGDLVLWCGNGCVDCLGLEYRQPLDISVTSKLQLRFSAEESLYPDDRRIQWWDARSEIWCNLDTFKFKIGKAKGALSFTEEPYKVRALASDNRSGEVKFNKKRSF